ncbi:MAG: protein-L-isoaspartate(D-aspartate) O-methyltransferase [Nitrospirae bacterium]|nr:protein-L-isoaspartate(D-aspartate) O-methyltransferase [Nitrospirota bacterium]
MNTPEDKTRDQEYAVLRRLMVEEQLVWRGIQDPRVLEAMRRVPRHRFVGEWQEDRAYGDHALPIGGGQTISQPYMVALMTEALALRGGEKVLEIGTGSGYQAAVLAELGARVFSMERIPLLASRALDLLREVGYPQVTVRVSDGTLGWPEESPFDGIIVTAGAPEIPLGLTEQLAPGGRIVIPVGDRYSQTLIRGVRTTEGMEMNRLIPCMFVPLVGKFGWRREDEGL